MARLEAALGGGILSTQGRISVLKCDHQDDSTGRRDLLLDVLPVTDVGGAGQAHGSV